MDNISETFGNRRTAAGYNRWVLS